MTNRALQQIRRAPAWTLTATLGLAYVILAPPSTDLAAAGYRSDLFSRAGLTLWDNAWYGGHHLLAYSVLAPALGALLGPQLEAALSMTAAAGLFSLLIDGRFPARASRLAALWFALGAAIGLLANRVPFDLGLAIGLGALLAGAGRRARGGRRMRTVALALAVLCSLASPVAGAFLALAALAWALADHAARSFALSLALAALAPIGALALAFPEGGTQPFVASAFYPALAGVLLIAALIPPELRVLRAGAALYALTLIAAYLIPTAVGGNADRLGALSAGPLAACVLAGGEGLQARGTSLLVPGLSARRRRGLLAVLAPALLYWQANAAVADFASAAADPAVTSSYYAPLLQELRALGVGFAARPARIEVVPTRDHWEARVVAARVMIARGWERQLDRERGPLFYTESGQLTAASYRAWLLAQGVSFIALPDAPLDYSATAEARLLRGRPPSYLKEIWRSAHWRLFEVLGASALAQPPSVLQALGTDSFTLQAPRAGAFVVRVHFSPYWALADGHGCVGRAPGDWTQVQAPKAGGLHVVIAFSLVRVFEHGPRCR